MRDVADFLFINVHTFLDGFCDIIRAGHAPIYKIGYYRLYDPSFDGFTLSDYERWQRDKIILGGAMLDFFTYYVCIFLTDFLVENLGSSSCEIRYSAWALGRYDII